MRPSRWRTGTSSAMRQTGKSKHVNRTSPRRDRNASRARMFPCYAGFDTRTGRDITERPEEMLQLPGTSEAGERHTGLSFARHRSLQAPRARRLKIDTLIVELERSSPPAIVVASRAPSGENLRCPLLPLFSCRFDTQLLK